VRDNGRGLPPQGRGSDGLGLQLVRLLAIKQLRGKIVVAHRRGTEVTVSFPLTGSTQSQDDVFRSWLE
jgi:two-component sensor histidine kinase